MKKTKTPTVEAPVQPIAIPEPAPVSSDLLTVAEVAVILRVDGTTVRRWVKNGALEAVVLPHQNERQAYRIKRETLNKILGKPTHA